LRPNLTPLALSSASPRAVRSRMRAPASSRRQEWQNDLGKVRRGVEAALGKRTDAGVRALHLAGDHQKVGCVAQEPVNVPGYHHVAGASCFISFPSCDRSAVVPGRGWSRYQSASRRAPALLHRPLSAWCANSDNRQWPCPPVVPPRGYSSLLRSSGASRSAHFYWGRSP